ncbi:MAG: GNAT family N-acetyltransferase [Actinobacteria bacterium]|nr:GNAT family N-acetyltransferase [Actinomycetota bacterium]
MDVDIQLVAEEEFPAWIRAIEAAFHYVPKDEDIAMERSVAELDRSLVAMDGAQMVGAAAAYSLRLTVPGAIIPMAGVTAVGVRPTHRRQGILTALMQRQLSDVRERGETVAGLWASEGSIYGRFGYGVAALSASFEIQRDRSIFARPHRPAGTITLVDRKSAMNAMPGVYERLRPEQPGMLDRNSAWWEFRFGDLEDRRDGATEFFFALHRSQEGVDGYIAYRVKHNWKGLPKSVVQVREVLATSAETYADLWRYCFDVDLIDTIETWGRPVDEPLLFMVAEPRRLGLKLSDGLWVRIVDVAGALAARRYRESGRLVLEVRDGFLAENEGRYELHGGPDGAECRSSGAEPDLVLGAEDLGATYLGGVRFSTLARAGRVHERTDGAIQRADAMFGWDPLPWCPHVF